MPSYIVKNGHLQLRQKDNNLPTYRVIPYKSINNVTHNDYINNTIEQLQVHLNKIKQDYHNLIKSLWKVLSQIDSTPYDSHIMFFNLSQQQIYHQISLIRNLNLTQHDQQSLRLSVIIKVDQNSISSPREPFLFQENIIIQQTKKILQQQSPQRSFIKQIRQDSLYQIEQEQQNPSNTSRIEEQTHNIIQDHDQQKLQKFLPMIQRKKSSSSPQNNQNHHNNKCSPQGNSHHLNQTGEKRQSRRTSFLLKQKISMALHQQQQLRQILQEQVQKLTQQLDQKNEYLTWTVEQLRMRNQLIEKLKQTILLRDEALQMQQQQLNNRHYQHRKNHQLILQQKDKQIGLLINSLIERTDQTYEDFQYLTKSIQLHNQHYNSTQLQIQQQNQADKTIDIQELQNSVQFNSISQNQSIVNRSQLPNQKLYQLALSPSSNLVETHSRLSSQLNKSCQQDQKIDTSVLQPKKMNFQQTKNITYLTKQHFLQAQRKTAHNYILSNVKMIESVQIDSSGSLNTTKNQS